MPKRMFSSTPPIGGATAVVRTVAQESLPAVTGKVQVGTTGGAAAALDGKAIKPTPRAPAEAKSSAIRLLERMMEFLLLRAAYGRPIVLGRLRHPLECRGFRPLIACPVTAVRVDVISY